MNFPALLSIILTLFFLMACGYVCRKIGIIDGNASKAFSRLILSVAQPMLVINALNNAPYTEENLTSAWQFALIGFAAHVIMSLAAFLICKLMKQDDKTKIFEFSLVFANCGFIGFPILDSLFGNGIGSFMGSFYFISFHLFLWTWGLLILGRGRDDIKLNVKKILFNYGTVPCAIGIALYLLKPVFVLPDCVGTFLSYLASLCTPISVLVTGSLLATVSLKKMFTNPRLYLHSAIKLIAFPVAGCLIAKVCGLSETQILVVTAMMGVPSAATVTMLSELYSIEPGYASESVGMTSLLSTATLPFVMLFAQWIAAL